LTTASRSAAGPRTSPLINHGGGFHQIGDRHLDARHLHRGLRLQGTAGATDLQRLALEDQLAGELREHRPGQRVGALVGCAAHRPAPRRECGDDRELALLRIHERHVPQVAA
jgi:hypothetical protein